MQNNSLISISSIFISFLSSNEGGVGPFSNIFGTDINYAMVPSKTLIGNMTTTILHRFSLTKKTFLSTEDRPCVENRYLEPNFTM